MGTYDRTKLYGLGFALGLFILSVLAYQGLSTNVDYSHTHIHTSQGGVEGDEWVREGELKISKSTRNILKGKRFVP